jgi:ATP-dependent protease ClpP protease subunit
MTGRFTFKAIAFFITAMLVYTSALALQYNYVEFYDNDLPKKLKINGRIVSGDYEKLKSFLISNPGESYFGTGLIELDSPGGDVLEAIKISNLLKSISPKIWVNGTCASSCLLLWLSGSTHKVGPTGRVGIHRPTFPESFYREKATKNVEIEYEKMVRIFRDFVINQGLPNSIYEKLISTSSDDIYWLSKSDLNLIGTMPAYLEEKQQAICGDLITRASNNSSDRAAFEKARSCIFSIDRDIRISGFDIFFGKNNEQWNKARRILLQN